uniref:Ig-like domain-containing protein n=1 Tax=Mola mola TaxID=94237 RepID=A0A3Q3XFN2_MOLML
VFTVKLLDALPVFQLCLCATGGNLSSVVSCFKVVEGGVASLTCQYSVKRYGLSRVCWGRGCGTFWCNNILVQTDEHGVISKVADRYRLTGDVLDGQMDLDILNVRRTDGGPYCCRVDIDGVFNDKKVIMNLRVVKGGTVDPRDTGGAGGLLLIPVSAKHYASVRVGTIRIFMYFHGEKL